MIRIARPCLGEEEIKAVTEVIQSGWVTQGPTTEKFEMQFAKFVGASFATAVSNCTTAMQLALKTAGVRPGDVVLCPSYSFIATANAVRNCGAEPFFIDVSRDDLAMSPELTVQAVEEHFVQTETGWYLRDRTRFKKNSRPHFYAEDCGRLAAALPVHQLGIPAPVIELKEICARLGIPMIEDAACAIGSSIGDIPIGQPIGDAVCFSFHPRKLLVTGEGGMITTNDSSLARSYKSYRQHCMSSNDLERHRAQGVVFETYEDAGFNFRLTDIQSALGIAQLNKLPAMINHRRELAALYNEKLADVDEIETIEIAPGNSWNVQTYQIYFKTHVDLLAIMNELKRREIETRRGVMCAHLEAPYRDFWPEGQTLQTSEQLRRSTLTLPMHNFLTEADIDKVTLALKSVLKNG